MEQCVVKLFSAKSRELSESKVQGEIKFWKEINGIEPYQLTLNGKVALVMPYLEPLSATEKKQFLDSTSSIYQRHNSHHKLTANRKFTQ